MVDAFVSRMDSITTLPWESTTATEIVLDERPAQYTFHRSSRVILS
jgi:hypothetical protein